MSNNIILADSFAISTAVSTDIPISASFMAAASLIPSPKNPTVWPLAFSAVITLVFWVGDSLANTLVSSTAFLNNSSSISSISEPSSNLFTLIPTCLQTDSVTLSLSPVRILTLTP